MEFASEMVVRAGLAKLESPRSRQRCSPDGRSRPPHLRTWRDGWRHLPLLLLFSPRWLFFYPGFVMFCAGLAAMLRLLLGPIVVRGVTRYQYLALCRRGDRDRLAVDIFWICASIHGMREGIVPPDPAFQRALSR